MNTDVRIKCRTEVHIYEGTCRDHVGIEMAGLVVRSEIAVTAPSMSFYEIGFALPQSSRPYWKVVKKRLKPGDWSAGQRDNVNGSIFTCSWEFQPNEDLVSSQYQPWGKCTRTHTSRIRPSAEFVVPRLWVTLRCRIQIREPSQSYFRNFHDQNQLVL
jgi:hypothetical protein